MTETKKVISEKYGIELVKVTDTGNWVATRPGDDGGRCGIAQSSFEAVCRLLYAIDRDDVGAIVDFVPAEFARARARRWKADR